MKLKKTPKTKEKKYQKKIKTKDYFKRKTTKKNTHHTKKHN